MDAGNSYGSGWKPPCGTPLGAPWPLAPRILGEETHIPLPVTPEALQQLSGRFCVAESEHAVSLTVQSSIMVVGEHAYAP